MRDYPFINGETKTINVGVELIGYKPINIDYLLSLDIDSIKRMDTINSKPIRAV
jgi:calcineurin-like phosphoesterase family protein